MNPWIYLKIRSNCHQKTPKKKKSGRDSKSPANTKGKTDSTSKSKKASVAEKADNPRVHDSTSKPAKKSNNKGIRASKNGTIHKDPLPSQSQAARARAKNRNSKKSASNKRKSI